VLQAVQDEKCTALYGVPTMFIAELDHPASPLRPLQPAHRHHGRQPLPDRGDEAVIDKMNMRRGHHRLRHDRDLPVSFQSGTDDPIERRVSTVGRVQPHWR
jgi:fatty-acyl-CoA synthase